MPGTQIFVVLDLSYISFAGRELPPRARTIQVRSRMWIAPTPFRPEPLAPAETEDFITWVLNRSRVDPGAYRMSTLMRRVPSCLRGLKVHSTAAARELLEAQPDLLPGALNNLLLGVSEFFRDRPVFEHLAAHVLPELVRSRSSIRVLSAGCADGQELYSVAMLLAECGALDRSFLLGIDCRSRAIARARTGFFPKAELEAVPPDLQERYVRPENDTHGRICLALRDRIQWHVRDLSALNGQTLWDLILFRNVSIYWRPEETLRAHTRLAGSLSPGGILVLGKAERPHRCLGLTRLAPCIFRKENLS